MKLHQQGQVGIILLLIIVFSSAAYWLWPNQDQLIGQWLSDDGQYNIAFYADNTLSIDMRSGNYAWVGDDSIRVSINGPGAWFFRVLGGDLVFQVRIKPLTAKFDDDEGLIIEQHLTLIYNGKRKNFKKL